jgi:hypothetical protein
MFLRLVRGYQEVLQSYRHPVTRRLKHRCIARWSSGRSLEDEIAALETEREEALDIIRHPTTHAWSWVQQDGTAFLDGVEKERAALSHAGNGLRKGRRYRWSITQDALDSIASFLEADAGYRLKKLEKKLTALRHARDALRAQQRARTLSTATATPLAPVILKPQPETAPETFHVRMDGNRPVRLPVVEMTQEDRWLALAFQHRELALMAQTAAPTLTRLQRALHGQEAMSSVKLREAYEVAAARRDRSPTRRRHPPAGRPANRAG